MKKITEMIREFKEFDAVEKAVIIFCIVSAIVLTVIMVITVVNSLNGNVTTTDNNTVIVPIVTPLVHLTLII